MADPKSPWVPVAMLGLGLLGTWAVSVQPERPLRAPLAESLPSFMLGLTAKDVDLPSKIRASAGATDYIARTYSGSNKLSDDRIEVHVCYYSRLGPAKWSSSPGLCHLDPTWAIVREGRQDVLLSDGVVRVRRYDLRRDGGSSSAVALVWHQGRGRAAGDKLTIRWARARDALLHRRSEEAIVRVLVASSPRADSIERLETARRVAAVVIPSLRQALPSRE